MSSSVLKKVSTSADLAVIGTVAIDAVKTPFGEREKVFGGSASYFSYGASFFTQVALVAVVGKDFPDEYRRILEEKKIDLSHLAVSEGKTFHWKGYYGDDLNVANTLNTELNVLLEFNPVLQFEKVPPFVFLANIDPSLQIKVLDQIDRREVKFIACDTMNFWITSKKAELLKVLARIDCVILNDGEARQLTGENNLILAARKIRGFGPDKIIIKKGEHGSLLFYEDQFFALPAYPLEAVFDPTGAGDSFGGGVIGSLAACGKVDLESMKRAVVLGTVVASFTVEDFGLERLCRLSKKDIEERVKSFSKICSFTV